MPAVITSTLPLLSALVLLCIQVPAQQVLIMARDLLEAPRLGTAQTHRNRVQRSLPGDRADDDLPRMILGEATLIEAKEARPVMAPGDLQLILERISGAQAGAIESHNDMPGFVVDLDEVEKVKATLELLRKRISQGITVSVNLQRISKTATQTLLRASQNFRAGETVTLADTSRQNKLISYETEIAQASSMGNPVVISVSTGSSISLRARPIFGSEFALLEAVVRTAEALPAGDLPPSKGSVGPIQRVSTGIAECAATFRIPRNGKTVHSWSDENGDELRLTCTASWKLAPPLTRGDLVIHTTSLLHDPVLEFHSTQAAEDPEELPSSDHIASILESTLENESRTASLLTSDSDVSTGTLMLTGPHARAVEANVLRTLDQALAPTKLSILILDLPAGTSPDANGKLPDSGRTIARIEAPALVNRIACFTGGRERSSLHDWESEVAQAARMPHPEIRMICEGYFINALVEANSSGKPQHFTLEGTWAYIDKTDVVQATLDQELTAPDSTTKTSSGTTNSQPAIHLPQDIVALEQPQIRSKQISTRLSLDAQGKATLRRSATQLLGQNRELLILLQAH